MKQLIFFTQWIFDHYARLVVMGLLDSPQFAGQKMHLQLQFPPRNAAEMEQLLARVKPSAAVIFHLHADLLAMLLSQKVPCVIVNADTYPWAEVPVVEIDHAAIGRMAADYFIERKYSRFCVARTSDIHVFTERQSGFTQRLARFGFPCETFLIPDALGTDKLFRPHKTKPAMRDWLLALPKPCAMFATNDEAGFRMIEACHELGIRVPEDVSVLGVDNAVLTCRTALTPLSSISLPFEEQGRRAAQILSTWDPANPPGRVLHRIPPTGVVSRASTTSLLARDPMVARALEYIELHISEPFHISDLRALTGVSTPTLAARFKAELGITPIEVVRRERIAHAKKLLLETDHSVGMTAKQSGFRSPERFCTVFHELVGQTPLEYRQSVRET